MKESEKTYQNKTPNWLQRFFILCSGANQEILNDCPSEWNKYSGFGATIFFTSVFAAISGGYFLTFVFNNEASFKLILPLGILWGLLILNLDRNIITSIKKSNSIKKELSQAWLRILLAIFIGIVIATPLELKIFEKEIVEKAKSEYIKEKLAQIETRKSSLESSKLVQENQKKNLDSLATVEFERYEKEVKGQGGSGFVGEGTRAKSHRSKYDVLSKQRDSLETSISQLNVEINKLGIKSNLDSIAINYIHVDGPEARTKALYQLSGMHWVITLLFILLEVLPVFVKLMSKRGPYDEILDRVEYEYYIREQELISRWNTKINELLDKAKEAAKLEGEVFIKVEKQRLDYELQNNKNILDDLSKKQEHLAKIAIENWYQDELKKSQVNPTLLPSLEAHFWRMKGSPDKVEFCFRNGLSNNELIYNENGKVEIGQWNYSPNKDKITVKFQNKKYNYLIKEISGTALKLSEEGTTETIEFEKV